jgi:hypothetical protein
MLNLIVYNAKTGQALSVQQCKSLVWLRLYSKFPQTLVVTSVFFSCQLPKASSHLAAHGKGRFAFRA